MAKSVIHRRCYIVLFDGEKRVDYQKNIGDAKRSAVKFGNYGEHVTIYYDQCYGDNILVSEFDIGKIESG